MIRKIGLIALLFSLVLSLPAQRQWRIDVDGSAFPVKNQAVLERFKEMNDGYCAGILLLTDLEELTFDSYIPIKHIDLYNPGVYLLYVSPREMLIEVGKDGWRTLRLFLHRHGVTSLESGEVWGIRLKSERSSGFNRIDDLTKIGPPGQVLFYVRPQPAGARLWLDGQYMGQQRRFRAVAGGHTIQLKHDGYRVFRSGFTIPDGDNIFHFRMQTVDPETVVIESEPTGAEIFINGKPQGKTPRGFFLDPDMYDLRLTYEGYADINHRIEVKEDQDNTFAFTMEKDQGILILRIEPEDSELYLDGQPINPQVFTDSTGIALSPGEYDVKASYPGFFGQERTVEIERGKTSVYELSLERKEGTLQFNVLPLEAEAQLWQDDRLYKDWSGMLFLKGIPIGSYELVVQHEGYLTVNRNVTIKTGTVTPMEIMMERGLTGQNGATTLRWVPGGTYIMGDTFNEGTQSEMPTHSVSIRDFFLGSYEVTQEEWYDVMEYNPSRFFNMDHPVERVSWLEAIEFCNRKSYREELEPCYEIEKPSIPDSVDQVPVEDAYWTVTFYPNRNGYRLPTEAEWEYAAKGGMGLKVDSYHRYSGGDSLDVLGWYGSPPEGNQPEYQWLAGNTEATSHPVGKLEPNQLGLYDMTGNVAEWCWDWYDPSYYDRSEPINPLGPDSGTLRVIRGGSWFHLAFGCRNTARNALPPFEKKDYVGLRLARNGEETVGMTNTRPVRIRVLHTR